MTEMHRAYSVIELKAVDDDARVIEGIASTPTPDRVGDIVEPMGAQFTVPMPLLWQHDHTKPVGSVEFAKPSSKGIRFRAKIARVSEPPGLKARLDEAWQSVKAGLVRAVSIGFSPLEHSLMENGGYRFLSWDWIELSLVTIPANAEATITNIKSIDTALRAASGKAHGDAAPAEPAPEAATEAARIVRLHDPARARAKPFVIRTIHPI